MPEPELAPFAAEESRAVSLARTLADRVAFDRGEGNERAYVDALIAQLRRDRLVWAAAPVAIGGLGGSLGELAQVTFHLARASGSLGLIYAMHASQALTLLRHGGGSRFFARLTARLVENQALVASGTSEKGVGGDIFGSLCRIRSGEDGRLSVSKESPNISYLDHAPVILVTAVRTGPRDRETQVLVAAETGQMEVTPGPEARLMGMRGILNRPYRFTARFDEGAIFGEPYPAIARATMTPSIHILWAALWSGLAASGLARARACLAKSSSGGTASDLLWTELSRLTDRHYVLNALIRDAVDAFERPASDGGMSMAHTMRIKRLKIAASSLVQEICIGALGLIGMRAYAETGPDSLSEIIRDALSAPVMISNYRLLFANAPVERFIEEDL